MKNHIRQYRQALGLTQQELADLVSVDHTTISKWENGAPVSDRYKRLLARALQCAASELFSFVEEG